MEHTRKIGNMELVLDPISVDGLTGFLQRDSVPRPYNMLFDGSWRATCWLFRQMKDSDIGNLASPFKRQLDDEEFGYLERVLVTLAANPRLLEFLQL